MSQSGDRKVRNKSSLWSVVKIVLGLALVALVFSKTDLEQLLSLRHRISWLYLGLTIVLFFLLSMLKAWQYHRLLNSEVAFPQALNVAIMQNAISNFIATSAGAIAFMTVLKAEQGIKLSRSASVFILLKICDLASLWLGLVFVLPFIWGQAAPLYYSILILVVTIGAGLLVFALGLLNLKRFSAFFQLLLERSGFIRFGMVQKGLDFLNTLAWFDRKELLRLIGVAAQLSILYFILTIVWSYSSMHAFGLPVSIWTVAFVTAILQLLAVVPVHIFGGLGVTDAVSLYLFGLFGFASSELAAVLIGVRLLFYLTNLIVLLYLPLYPLFSSRQGRAPGEP